MSKINVQLGITLSLGPGTYEFVRYDFGVEDETRPGETTSQAFDRVYEFVEAKLKEKVDEDRKNIGHSQNTNRKATGPGSNKSVHRSMPG